MAFAARDTAKFFPKTGAKSADGQFADEIGYLLSSQPALRPWIASERDQSIMLFAQAVLGDGETVHTGYFEAIRPCEIGAVIFPGATVPVGFSAMTAEIRVTRGVAAEESGMTSDTAISIFAGTRVVLSVDHDDAAATAAASQLWYLATGDKARIKVVSVGSSGEIVATAMYFQMIVRER